MSAPLRQANNALLAALAALAVVTIFGFGFAYNHHKTYQSEVATGKLLQDGVEKAKNRSAMTRYRDRLAEGVDRYLKPKPLHQQD